MKDTVIVADGAGFRHELYPYSGEGAFVAGALSFIDDARSDDGLVLVAVPGPKQQLLRDELAEGDSCVTFVDMASLGRNPGRLIPVWQAWISSQVREGRALRGIGESQWMGRSAAEVAELRYHEWLLNEAFAQSPEWWLLCPYDMDAGDAELFGAMQECHPFMLAEGAHQQNPGYARAPYALAELEPPMVPFDEFAYTRGDLPLVRDKVAACAAKHGMGGSRLREVLVAVTEVASNSIRHGGGHGVLRTWADSGVLVCEFRDGGFIEDPMVGRVRPTVEQAGGRGMWLVHQLSDLVQIRSTPAGGTVVRLHNVVPHEGP